MTPSDGEDVIIDDLRTRALRASAAPHAAERLAGAGYRSVLGVSTPAPEPLVRVAFWSKQPLAFNRSHAPLVRRIAYRLGLRASGRELATIAKVLQDCRGHNTGRATTRFVTSRGSTFGFENPAKGSHERVITTQCRVVRR